MTHINPTPRRATVAALALLLAAPLVSVNAAEEKLPKMQREKTIYQVASGAWNGPRLADGQPDVQGFWSNTIANHANLTDPQGGVPGETRRTPLGPREERAPAA